VGPQLAGALIFVAITASFYNSLAQRVPSVDTSSSNFRQSVSPLNKPSGKVDKAILPDIREASAHSFRLAMLLSAALMFAGAAVNAVGIRNGDASDPGADRGPKSPPP